jgi:Ser/Thr protein kinase RdoA (MazF antagonist)
VAEVEETIEQHGCAQWPPWEEDAASARPATDTDMVSEHAFHALSPEDQLAHLGDLVADVLPRYGLPASATVLLINHSENTTFRIDNPETGWRGAIRVHREAYHTKRGIECELAWMRALREEGGVPTPKPVAALDGDEIQSIDAPSIPNPRYCVLFEWIEGEPPDESQLIEPFKRLGEVTARTHRHSKAWRLPPNFERLTWDYETALGARPNWGRWEAAPGLDDERTRLIARTCELIRRRLDAYGKSPDRFGLIHADFRLANLIIYEGDTRVIDFDDSGFGYYFYDLATALSFMEERPEVPELIEAWLEGYRRVLPVSRAEEEEIQTFLLLRRILILAWMGSHAETELAKELGVPYTNETLPLAEAYLVSHG